MLQNNSTLKTLINNLWDALWSGGISNPITAIEQITYLLFMKQLDRIESKAEIDVKNGQLKEKDFRFKFRGKYSPFVDEDKYKISPKKMPNIEIKVVEKALKNAQKERLMTELRWSYFSKLEPTEELVEHIKLNVFPFIKTLNGNTSFFTKHMTQASFMLAKPSLLGEVIKKIDEIYLEIERDAKVGGHTIQDIQGDVYEMLLNEIAQSGKNGQFRTPRHLIKFMVELVGPKLGDKITDPTCGSGGFLVGAYQYILTEFVRKFDEKKLNIDDDGFQYGTYTSLVSSEDKKILNESLIGFDIDVTMVRLGLMNLMMHGVDNPEIDLKDTLSKSFNEDNKFDVILANPPFTGKIDREDINSKLRVHSASSELLFLDRISSMLKVGGKAAVIVPEGVLFGASNAQKQTKEILLKDNCLEAVISLPAGAFKPYTGVKTAILLFTKRKQNSNNWSTKKIWFYELLSDGYSLDDNRRRLKDFPLLDGKLAFFRRESEKIIDRKKYFYVPLEEIIENDFDLSFNRYKDYIYDEKTYDLPKDILASLRNLEGEILDDMDELNNLLG